MRTGPFSDARVIELLNACFVPVYAINEDYAEAGPVDREEKAEYQRIYRESLKAGLSTGTVHVYLLNPQGKPIGSLHVAEASKTDVLLALLHRVRKDMDVKPGKTIVAPKGQSVPPAHERGSLVLHLVARGLSGGGSWPGTAENWVVYTPAEIKRLLPASAPQPGLTWQPDAELTARLLRHVYPVTENNDAAKNRIEQQTLTAKVMSVKDQVCRVRLNGRLRMKHDFYHKSDGNEVNTCLVGYLDFEPATGKVRTLRLITREGRYGGGTFGVAIRSEAEASPAPARK
jgi:hypothetical protein